MADDPSDSHPDARHRPTRFLSQPADQGRHYFELVTQFGRFASPVGPEAYDTLLDHCGPDPSPAPVNGYHGVHGGRVGEAHRASVSTWSTSKQAAAANFRPPPRQTSMANRRRGLSTKILPMTPSSMPILSRRGTNESNM